MLTRPLLASALLVALVGCGDSDSPDSDSPDAAGQETSAAAAVSPLTPAYDACGPELIEGMKAFGDDAPPLDQLLILEDEGTSLIVTTPEPRGEITSNLAFLAASCVLEETDAPATVIANMQATTAMAGAQTATWDDIEVVWSYAAGVGNAGFNATFAFTG